MPPGDVKVEPERAPSERGLSPTALAYRRAEPYTAAASTLMAAVGGCTAAGWALDRWLGHRVQWMLIVGAVLGIAIGFVGFFTQVLRADARRRAGH